MLHHLNSDRDGIFEAKHDHPHRIADENDRYLRLVQQFGHRIIVCGERGNDPLPFHCGYIGWCKFSHSLNASNDNVRRLLLAMSSCSTWTWALMVGRTTYWTLLLSRTRRREII